MAGDHFQNQLNWVKGLIGSPESSRNPDSILGEVTTTVVRYPDWPHFLLALRRLIAAVGRPRYASENPGVWGGDPLFHPRIRQKGLSDEASDKAKKVK